MNTGDGGKAVDLKRLPSKQTEVKVAATASKMNRMKETATQVPSSKLSATSNTSIKTKSTTATVSKITRLVLKPKPTTPKSSLASKMTTKKYTTKPVTIKSRSTVISHESTFRIRNIKKSPPNKRQNVENTKISVKSEQISHQVIVNANEFDGNKVNDNLTSLNVTKIVNSPVLQEITSAVVNGSNVINSATNDFNLNMLNNVNDKQNITEKNETASSPQKATKHCENDTECKRKSYDPIKARQFIQMQREKWKEAEKTDQTKTKAPVSKEEIKQRLSALKKNSLKIVSKNVQRARKSGIKPTKTITPGKPASPIKTAVNSKVSPQIDNVETPQMQQLSQSKLSSLALTPSKFLPSIKSEKNRIGILRRAEGNLPTLDSPKLIASTPTLALNHTHRISNIDCSPLPAHLLRSKDSKNVEPRQFDLEPKVPETVPLKSMLFNELKTDEKQQPNRTDLFFEQNVESGCHINYNDNGNGFEYENKLSENVTTSKKEIPFWLRPTPVQPYPYNFIMAVRKKLESITHPVSRTNQQHQAVFTKSTTPYQSPIARPRTKFVTQFRRNLNRRTSDSESVSENAKSSDVSPVKASNGTEYSEEREKQDQNEEYSMNFASVTRESMHDESDVHSKSKRKSVRASQDTLSISSGILSHSSPEKKIKANSFKGRHVESDDEPRLPSPLTTDNVDGLQITSQSQSHIERTSNENSAVSQSVQSMKSTQSSLTSSHASQSSKRSTMQSTRSKSIESNLNFRRGRDFSPSKQPSLSDLSEKKSVEELLRDFTSSLSQVIKVNQRLHTILSNPPSSRESKYTDDFENASDNRQSGISEHISGTVGTTSVSSNQTQHIDAVQGNTKTSDKISEISGLVSNEFSSRSSTQNQIKSAYSVEESEQIENQSTVEPSSRLEKESSTLIEEKINESQTSESPTNNDLKSITLSIAQKSAATSDDTDQPSNAIESFNKQITGEKEIANESIGSNIFNMFNKTTMNLAEYVNNSVWSEHNISYLTLGMCDQLLKSETRKSEDLSSLLKIREKVLIDRFKGQIAWLELQKQKYRESGLTAEISMIKKKQRALLLRLNNDRKELHRILKNQERDHSMSKQSNVNFNISQMTTNMSIRRTSVTKQLNSPAPKQALKAIELPGGGSALEIMLQRREDELRRRREHVEKLLKWHRRLDIEEQEVIKMERMIMFISTSDVYQTTSHEQINDTVAITVHHHSKRTNCQHNDSSMHEHSLTNVTDTITMEKTRFEQKKQKQIHKIEKSLNTLKMVSTRSISSDGSNVDDVVKIYGPQLNKLWKRLTGEYEEKYAAEKVYTLSKLDLEQLYEHAKLVVLSKFHASEEFKRRLIDNSMSIVDGSHNHSTSTAQHTEIDTNIEKPSEAEIEPIVPTLNLASSPEQRENLISATDQGYYFSNSNIEPSSVQNHQTAIEAIIAPISEATSQSIDGSQIQTDLQIEDDDESTSHQDEIQSDITEDSLNKPQSSKDVSPSEIQTGSQTNESHIDESGQSSQIPSAFETVQSSGPLAINMSNDNTQLIEETSFPNIDVQTTVSSVEEDFSNMSHDSLSPVKNASSHPSDEQKYRSDDFENEKSADELTSISTATVTKMPTTTTTTTTNQSSEKSVDKSTEKLSEQSPTPTNESPKELEQRLILIDEGLRELSERISQSPVLQSDSESQNASIESEKSSSTKSSSSESVSKSDEDVETAENTQSVGTSEGEKTAETSTKASKSSTENEASVVNDLPKAESDESTDSIAAEIAASKVDHPISAESLPPKRPFQYTLSAGSIDYNKVPEADALKRSQVPPLETELKMAEQSSSMFPFLREIPNKPPPPYPVHRQLPKTPPFPTDDRIKEIVFARIQDLYEKPQSDSLSGTPIRTDATFTKSPSVPITSPDSPAMQDEINVFERIIFDCCEEIIQEMSTPEKQAGGVVRQPLGFFNPPNRLRCYQEHALKRVFKLLNRPHPNDGIQYDESKSFSGMRSFLPSQVAQLTYNNRRKRDAVDDILIQELYEDEARWTNFDLEEKEIRENVPDLRTLLADESSDIQETSVNASTTE